MTHHKRDDRASAQFYQNQSSLEVLYSEDVQAEKTMRLAILMALLTLLALIWAPIPLKGRAVPPPVKIDPEPIIVTFKQKPKQITQSEITNHRQRVPMPDPDPQSPEPDPEIDLPEIPEPQLIELDTQPWDLDVPAAPVAPERIFDPTTQGLEAPVFTRRVKPQYPRRGALVRMEGSVFLEAVLRRDGTITDIKVLRPLGSGNFGFEAEAIEALKQWQFVPGLLQGQPVDVRLTLKIDFIFN